MKENNDGNDTNVGSIENSIEEDIEILVAFILAPSLKHISEDELKDVQKAIKHILLDYRRLQEDFKAVDHECSRLERKEVEMEKIIDLMAKEIDSLYTSLLGEFGMWSTGYSQGGEITTDEIKQYFINKAKEVK